MILSQFLVFGLYIQGNMTQAFLSLNRFATICFLGSNKRKNSDLIALGIFTSWFATVIWTLMGYPGELIRCSDCDCAVIVIGTDNYMKSYCNREVKNVVPRVKDSILNVDFTIL